MDVRIFLMIVFCCVAFSAFAADETVSPTEPMVAVPAHEIARGSVIQESDLVYKTIPATRTNYGFIADMSDAVGKEARRVLRAGEFIRSNDLKRPALVAKGSSVTMVFETRGMILTATGRALAEGGAGEIIPVLNPTSYRKVEATVVAPGTVRVDAPTIPRSLEDVASARR